MFNKKKKTGEKLSEGKRIRRAKLSNFEPVEINKTKRTEGMSIEDVLRASDEKYRPLFDNMLNGFAYCRIILNEENRPADFIYLDVNNAFERLTGLRKEDVVGKKVTEAIPGIKEAHPELFNIYGEVALTGKETEFEIFFKPLEVWLSISVYSPAKSYFVAIFENITKQKQAEEIIASLARFPSENPYPVLQIAKDGTIVYSNQSSSPILDQLGCKQGGQVSYDWLELVNEVFNNQKTQEAEIECDGRVFSLTFTPVRDAGFVNVYGLDITVRKRAEEEREVMIKLLSLINSSNNMHELMRLVLVFLKDWSGCQAVGIRLAEGEDYPYYVTEGFSDEFVEAENKLCSVDELGEKVRDSQGRVFLECMCGNVISGRYDPSKPFFTRSGSFWTNSTTDLLARTTEKDRITRTRNRCNTAGYESVALIPLRSGGETFGLLQFNDIQRGRFTLERVSFFERLADNLAIGLAELKAEQSLRISEARLSEAMHIAKLGYWEYDVVENVFTFTDQFYSVYRISAKKVGGYKLTPERYAELFLFPEDVQELGNEIRTAIEAADPNFSHYVEHRVKFGDGEIGYVSIRYFVIKDSQGCTVKTHGVNQDITERKRAEEALKDKEVRHKTILQTAMDGFWLSDMAGRFLEVNDAYCQMSGYSREELAQMSIPQVEDAETPEEVKRHIQRIVSRGSDRFESLHRRKDGSVFQVEVSVNFLPIEDGRLFCFLRDITERKKAEQVLLESEIRYRELFESMGNGVAVYEAVDDGADFVFSNMNKAGEKSGRVERTEIIGRRVTEVFPRIKDIGLLDVFRRVWLTGEPEHHPVSFYKDERISQWVDNYVYKLPTGEIVAVYDDVTKRKEVEEKLYEYQKQLKSMASQVSKVQEQERRNIAVEMHDRISQHLAMAKVNVQIAAKSSTDAEVRDKLRKTAEEIGRVIEDAYSLMVELSNPVLYEIGLKAAIETLLKDRIRPEYNIEYVLEADDDDFKLDDVISVPLYQAVRELLRNVIKHSKANKVIVSIHKVGSNIQIAVRDNGVGFVTSIAGKSNKIKTGGFGLFSTKENVEHINGKLKIESEPGRGTVAIISAPFGFKTKPDLGGK